MKTLILIFGLYPLTFFAQTNNNWENYIQPLLDSISKKTDSKIYLYQRYVLIDKDQGSDFDSIMNSFYNIQKEDWICIYDSWILNRTNVPSNWKKSISSRKKQKILNNWDKKKSLIYNLSLPVFIRPNNYILQITSYCPGRCGTTYVYFLEYDEKAKKSIIKHKINTSVM